jgi:hypothetical protein
VIRVCWTRSRCLPPHFAESHALCTFSGSKYALIHSLSTATLLLFLGGGIGMCRPLMSASRLELTAVQSTQVHRLFRLTSNKRSMAIFGMGLFLSTSQLSVETKLQNKLYADRQQVRHITAGRREASYSISSMSWSLISWCMLTTAMKYSWQSCWNPGVRRTYDGLLISCGSGHRLLFRVAWRLSTWLGISLVSVSCRKVLCLVLETSGQRPALSVMEAD